MRRLSRQGVGGPERPQDEQWLEKEPGKPSGIAVESECVGFAEVLGDISRKNHHKECGGYPAHLSSIAPGQDQQYPESDLSHPGGEDDEVGLWAQPGGDLGLEL